MATEKKPSELKVTDKRIFTPDGELKEEFANEIRSAAAAAPPQQPPPSEKPVEAQPQQPPAEEKPAREKGVNPGTPFASFVESLVVQAYMSLGMLRSPYGDVPVDPAAARQMIDILSMLREKTEGNLSEDEGEFLDTHLGELKLAWVRQSKSI